jgi:hypothetical protein
MEFMDVVAARKSVRSYANKPVEEEKLSKVLEAARPGAFMEKQTKLQIHRCTKQNQNSRVGWRLQRLA